MDRVGPEEESSPTEADTCLHPSLMRQYKEEPEIFPLHFDLKSFQCNCAKESLLTPGGALWRGGEDTHLLISRCPVSNQVLGAEVQSEG